MRIGLLAVGVAVAVSLIAWRAPHPTDLLGSIALGVAAGLAVVVGWLARIVRDRGDRLRRIEELLRPRDDD